jgi:hypothetical protein
MGYVSALDHEGRTLWIVAARREIPLINQPKR